MSKPVAFGMRDKEGNIYDCICPEEHDSAEGSYTVPLYTHPVKQLSDGEIEVFADFYGVDCPEIYDFARAIIKEITE